MSVHTGQQRGIGCISMSEICFDIETNGLLSEATVIHCICTEDMITGEKRSFRPHEIEEGLAYLSEANVLIGHNICGYDFRVMKKLHDWKPRSGQGIVDTFTLSCLLYPEGRHSLA